VSEQPLVHLLHHRCGGGAGLLAQQCPKALVDPQGLRDVALCMEVDPDFFVDFHARPDGPARAHEVRLQDGDCTTEIFQ
jgi:56kDa selenium binding protein (SBP56)